MNQLKIVTAVLTLGFAMAIATPVQAKSHAPRHPGYHSQAQVIGVDTGAEGVSGDRAQALRECEAKAGRFTDYAWGNYQSYQLRACMAEHGQPE
jgi:hypothetical protein